MERSPPVAGASTSPSLERPPPRRWSVHLPVAGASTSRRSSVHLPSLERPPDVVRQPSGRRAGRHCSLGGAGRDRPLYRVTDMVPERMDPWTPCWADSDHAMAPTRREARTVWEGGNRIIADLMQSSMEGRCTAFLWWVIHGLVYVRVGCVLYLGIGLKV